MILFFETTGLAAKSDVKAINQSGRDGAIREQLPGRSEPLVPCSPLDNRAPARRNCNLTDNFLGGDSNM